MSEPLQLLATHEAVGATGRVKLDAYFTPNKLAQEAVGWLVRDGYLWPGMTALEPSAGRGAWIRALAQVPTHTTALDVDPDRVAELRGVVADPVLGDFETHDFGAVFDGIVGNPPFVHAEAHVRRALALRDARGVAAFLLRLAFLESKERIPFWKEHPASKIYVLSERPSFSGGSTDNAAYGVFVWAKWHRGPTQIEVMQWKGDAPDQGAA
jgi:hypothetical protein